MTINDAAKTVENRTDFINFVRLLQKDYEDNGDNWENGDLQSYLYGILSAADTAEVVYANTGRRLPNPPTWQFFAEMLVTATFYE